MDNKKTFDFDEDSRENNDPGEQDHMKREYEQDTSCESEITAESETEITEAFETETPEDSETEITDDSAAEKKKKSGRMGILLLLVGVGVFIALIILLVGNRVKKSNTYTMAESERYILAVYPVTDDGTYATLVTVRNLAEDEEETAEIELVDDVYIIEVEEGTYEVEVFFSNEVTETRFVSITEDNHLYLICVLG